MTDATKLFNALQAIRARADCTSYKMGQDIAEIADKALAANMAEQQAAMPSLQTLNADALSLIDWAKEREAAGYRRGLEAAAAVCEGQHSTTPWPTHMAEAIRALKDKPSDELCRVRWAAAMAAVATDKDSLSDQKPQGCK